MASLFIAKTDFVNVPYKIPNQNEETSLDAYLESKERQLLYDLLGYEFAQALIDVFEGSGTPDQKWIDLRDGAEYTYNNKTYKWFGLNNLLIPAVYAEWLGDTFDKATNIGIGLNQKENFTVISPATRIGRAWNIYSETCGSHSWQYNSLFGYLEANSADFTGLWDGYFAQYPGQRNVFDL